MKLFRLTLLGLALALPAASFAQWQWIDKDGRKVFSDQPPPSDVPAKSILRQPGPKSRASFTVETPAAAASAASATQSAKSAPGVPKISGKDKDLEEKKKKADAAEAEKNREKEEEIAKARADSCDRAKRAKASFDSGIRITRLNSKGEQEFLDDAARAAETKRIEGIIANDCKPAGG
ncbi:MAG: DUF4124 domain-containing protein [Ramlibacter sp.]